MVFRVGSDRLQLDFSHLDIETLIELIHGIHGHQSLGPPSLGAVCDRYVSQPSWLSCLCLFYERKWEPLWKGVAPNGSITLSSMASVNLLGRCVFSPVWRFIVTSVPSAPHAIIINGAPYNPLKCYIKRIGLVHSIILWPVFAIQMFTPVCVTRMVTSQHYTYTHEINLLKKCRSSFLGVPE